MLRIIASLPLRLKIFLGLILASIAVILPASYSANEYRRAVQPISGILTQSLANQRSDLMTTIATSSQLALRTLANDPLLIFSINGFAVAQQSSEFQIKGMFQRILNADPSIRQMRFLNTFGRALVSVPSTSDESDIEFPVINDYLRPSAATSGRLYVGPLRGTDAPELTYAIAVRGQETSLGYLVMRIDPSGSADPLLPSLYSSLRPQILETGTIIFYLLRSDGTVESPFAEIIGSASDAAQRARTLLAGETSSAREYVSPIINRSVTGYIIPLTALNRTLVAEAQLIRLGVEEDTGRFLLTLGVLVIGSLLLLIFVGGFFETLVIQPMKRLLAMSFRAARGERITIPTNAPTDEVGSVMRSIGALTTLARQDITALEARVEERTRDIQATRDIGAILSNIRDVDTILRRVVDLIRERFESIYHAQVFLVDPTRQWAVLRASTGEPGKMLLERGHRLAVGSVSVIGRTTSEAQPTIARDTSRDAVHRMNELLPETRAELALPLRAAEGVIGALDLQSKRVDVFSDQDIVLFQSIADQLTIALTNAQLFQESQTRLIEIEQLNRRLLGEAWRGYANTRQRAVGGGNQIVPKEEAWSDIQRQAVETKTLVERLIGDNMTFAVPVMLRDQVFGAVEWTVPQISYNENTRLLAWELAGRLAVSADNARLLEQSQRFAARERMVSDITNKLVQQANVEAVLQTAIRELGVALRVPQASIRLATTTAVSESAEPETPTASD